MPLNDCLYVLQATIPALSRSSLHRCLERHGLSRLPEAEGDKPFRKKFHSFPIHLFHLDTAKLFGAERQALPVPGHYSLLEVRLCSLLDHADMAAALPSRKR